MGNMVTMTSARVMWRKMVLLLFLPRLSLPSIRLYSTRLLPITEKMIKPDVTFACMGTHWNIRINKQRESKLKSLFCLTKYSLCDVVINSGFP